VSDHDLIVIGASAGGVGALLDIAARLPANLPASVCVVLHMPPNGVSHLPYLLGRAGPLPARHPRDGTSLRRGHIYVAPPDHHLLVQDGVLRLSRGPRENRSRPAIDPLFRSAALAHGPRVIGVVLSGVLDDGTAGLLAIKENGGVAIVQDPEEAAFSGMPRSALDHVHVDACLSSMEIGPALVELAGRPASEEGGSPVSEELKQEVETAAFELDELQNPDRPGIPSVFSCPECHGVLYEVREGDLVRYRCRVGHAYAIDSLRTGQDEAVEGALWVALRALEEKAELTRRLQRTAEQRGLSTAARHFANDVQATLQRAATLRQLLLVEPSSPPEQAEESAG
jgi:two-component system chemotaxis response regulator CheB